MGFRNRLVLFLVATLIGVQALTLISAYGVVRGNLIEHGRQDLAATSQAFTRQLNLVAERVADGVQVMALDYPLRQAIAARDRETIVSALRNHGWRIGAARMFLVGLNGVVDSDTQRIDAVGRAFPFPDLLSGASRNGRAMSLAALDGKVFCIVAVPVNAPLPIAFVAAAVPVDTALIQNLRKLSVLPAEIALAVKAPEGGYTVAAYTAGEAPHLRFSAFGAVALAEAREEEILTLATKLETPRNSAPVVAVFDYPLEQALQPFYDIAGPVGIALILGLIIASVGAMLIARGVSRPIEMLAKVARRIAGGDYGAVPKLNQRDEIGALSAALGQMVSAVAERETRLETSAAALEVARDEAVRANAAKSQFLANMSHELRTPLNAVIGFGDILHGQILGPIGNEKYLEYARDIRDSGAHLLALVEEVLALARVEVGTLQLSCERTQPGEVLQDALVLMNAMAEKGSVTLRIDNGAAAWPAIDADPAKLKQVFVNLISNAIKFTPAGGRVSVDGRVAGDKLTLVIADTGIGMRADDVKLALQPFYRVNSALNATYQGAGIGLPLSKAIVELHGGTLTIESEVGRGTRVIVELPAAVVANRAVEAA